MTAPRILAPNSPPQNPYSRIRGWHYDYVLDCGAIGDGDPPLLIDLPLIPGSPFCLRGIGGYKTSAESGAVSQLTGGFLQWTNANDQWLQTNRIGIRGDWPSGGLDALYEPVYNQVIYPSNSVLSVRLENLSGADWDNAKIIFRGTNLYYKDRIYSPEYPRCYNSLPYEKSLDITTIASGTTRDIPLNAQGADFVMRGAVLEQDTSVAGSIANLAFQITDQYGHPYSSDFIHYNWLFSSGLAQRPGIFYPEIYLPKDRLLLFNVQQNLASAPKVNLSLIGERIFVK